MKLYLLLTLLGGPVFAQDSWYFASDPAPAQKKHRHTRKEFYACSQSATALVAGKVLRIWESAQIDDFGTTTWYCEMLISQVEYSRSTYIANRNALHPDSRVTFSFTTDIGDKYPLNKKLDRQKRVMVFLIINNTIQSPYPWELKGPVFQINKRFFSLYKRTTWTIDSATTGSQQTLRQVQTKRKYGRRLVFIEKKYNQENKLVYKRKRTADSRNIFRTGKAGDKGRYTMSKITETWYDDKGRKTKTMHHPSPQETRFYEPVEGSF